MFSIGKLSFLFVSLLVGLLVGLLVSLLVNPCCLFSGVQYPGQAPGIAEKQAKISSELRI